MTNEKKLPPNWIEKYKQLGEDSLMLGMPISEMDRDSLFAIIGFLSQDLQNTRDRHAQQLNFLTTLNSKRYG